MTISRRDSLRRPAGMDAARLLVLTGITAMVGIVVWLVVSAAGTPTAFETEAGSIAGPAKTVTTANSSGGAAVQFGSATTTGNWFSGESDTTTTQDGSFAAWRGRAVEIGGTWASSENVGDAIGSPTWSIAAGTPYGNIPRMDYAIGAMINGSGETWAQAAAGAYDSRWAAQLQQLKSSWGNRAASNMYIRFAHEFNGNWYPWSVSTGDVGSFKTAWQRFYGLVQTNFPGAKVVWCANAGSSWNYGSGMASGVANLWPGDAFVDIVGVDSYNRDPWTNSLASFTAKATGSEGVETFRQFAATHGKPLAINEWSNSGVDNGGGGGESPAFIQAFHDWLVANGSQTPTAGKVLYEVLFNVAGYGDHYSMFPLNLETGNTTTAAQYQALW